MHVLIVNVNVLQHAQQQLFQTKLVCYVYLCIYIAHMIQVTKTKPMSCLTVSLTIVLTYIGQTCIHNVSL